jgi:hypothetical protein
MIEKVFIQRLKLMSPLKLRLGEFGTVMLFPLPALLKL